jgi:transcriptional regulator with XRE-family HTH domain
MSPGQLIREARRSAGLSQQALASRLGTTQSAIAGLESDRSSPRVATVERALRACGQELSLTAREPTSSIDETMVFENLKLTPEQRFRAFQSSYDNVREFALAARRSIGGVA